MLHCTSAHRLLHRSNPPSPRTPSSEQPGLIYLGLGGRSVNPPCRINEGKPNHLGRLLCVRPRLVCSALNAGQQPQSHSQPLATLLARRSRPMKEGPLCHPTSGPLQGPSPCASPWHAFAVLLNMASVHFRKGRTLLSPEEEEELGGWAVDGRSVRCLCLPCELRRPLPVIPMSLRS